MTTNDELCHECLGSGLYREYVGPFFTENPWRSVACPYCEGKRWGLFGVTSDQKERV